MSMRIPFVLRAAAAIAAMASCVVVHSAGAQTIIDQWGSVTAPLPPPLKAVMIDKNSTLKALAEMSSLYTYYDLGRVFGIGVRYTWQ